MPTLLTRLPVCIVACLAALASCAALAQDARWFRVELIVFSRDTPAADASGAATPEQWEPTPELSYPGAARFLVEPGRVKANTVEYLGESTVDEFGRQLVTILPASGTSGIDAENITPVAPQQEATVAPLPTDAEAVETEVAVIDEQVLLPTPFVTLPSQQQEFRGKAAYMQRSGRYSILFHETWLQPLADQDNALPIVVDRSGDTEQWPRLQGSVKLYLSRYLHLETNLWMNTSGDYLPGSWRMPAPPLGPPSLIIEDLSLPEELPEEENTTQDTLADGLTQPAVTEPAPLGDDPANLSQPLGTALEPALPAQPVDVMETVEEGPVYPWRHAVLLQQKRRMRSNEVHYIDHPLFGVIVKITPLTVEELSAIALAEAAATAADQVL